MYQPNQDILNLVNCVKSTPKLPDQTETERVVEVVTKFIQIYDGIEEAKKQAAEERSNQVLHTLVKDGQEVRFTNGDRVDFCKVHGLEWSKLVEVLNCKVAEYKGFSSPNYRPLRPTAQQDTDERNKAIAADKVYQERAKREAEKNKPKEPMHTLFFQRGK